MGRLDTAYSLLWLRHVYIESPHVSCGGEMLWNDLGQWAWLPINWFIFFTLLFISSSDGGGCLRSLSRHWLEIFLRGKFFTIDEKPVAWHHRLKWSYFRFYHHYDIWQIRKENNNTLCCFSVPSSCPTLFIFFPSVRILLTRVLIRPLRLLEQSLKCLLDNRFWLKSPSK